jgi:hypothetical protein
MWATLALASAMALPAQETSGSLKVGNERVTYGILGQERKDDKFMPGDLYIVSFDIDGLKVQPDGRIQYGIGVELLKGDKRVYKDAPQELEAVLALGGSRQPAYALTVIGTDTEPGQYTLKVTVSDRAAKSEQSFTRKFEVVPAKLGFVRSHFTYDGSDALPAPPLAVPGQNLCLNFAVVGFSLDDKKQSDVAVELNVTDDAGKAVLAKPFAGEAKGPVKPEFQKIIPMQFFLQLNRPGKFKAVLKVTDRAKKTTAEQSLDFAVQESK